MGEEPLYAYTYTLFHKKNDEDHLDVPAGSILVRKARAWLINSLFT